MYNILSLIIGILIAIMIVFNGILAQGIGSYLSLIIIHLLGFAAVGALMIFKRIKLAVYNDIPLYLYAAGVIGVFTVFFNNLSFSFLGASLTLALGLFGQSLASIIVDHYGLLGMSPNKFRLEKLLGLAIIVLGIAIMTLY